MRDCSSSLAALELSHKYSSPADSSGENLSCRQGDDNREQSRTFTHPPPKEPHCPGFSSAIAKSFPMRVRRVSNEQIGGFLTRVCSSTGCECLAASGAFKEAGLTTFTLSSLRTHALLIFIRCLEGALCWCVSPSGKVLLQSQYMRVNLQC